MSWPARLPDAAGRLLRLADILGGEFRANAVEVRGAGKRHKDRRFRRPAYLLAARTRSANICSSMSAPVRDKLLLGVVRAAYADYLAARSPSRWLPFSSRLIRARST